MNDEGPPWPPATSRTTAVSVPECDECRGLLPPSVPMKIEVPRYVPIELYRFALETDDVVPLCLATLAQAGMTRQDLDLWAGSAGVSFPLSVENARWFAARGPEERQLLAVLPGKLLRSRYLDRFLGIFKLIYRYELDVTGKVHSTISEISNKMNRMVRERARRLKRKEDLADATVDLKLATHYKRKMAQVLYNYSQRVVVQAVQDRAALFAALLIRQRHDQARCHVIVMDNNEVPPSLSYDWTDDVHAGLVEASPCRAWVTAHVAR